MKYLCPIEKIHIFRFCFCKHQAAKNPYPGKKKENQSVIDRTAHRAFLLNVPRASHQIVILVNIQSVHETKSKLKGKGKCLRVGENANQQTAYDTRI